MVRWHQPCRFNRRNIDAVRNRRSRVSASGGDCEDEAVIARLQVLLRGDADRVAESVSRAGFESIAQFSLIILMGAGVYGATLGLWRGPLQAFYTAIKFPLVIFLTCLGNGAINGMLAQILGSGLSFRQTAVAILMSFAIAAIILAGFAPLTLFVWFNAPSLESKSAILGHSVMLLTHVFVIALAGVIANRRLLGLLRKMSGSDKVARAVLFSWLAGNLFLGAQIAWTLRPFIGSPRLVIEFLRSDPLRGNFYEAVWRYAICCSESNSPKPKTNEHTTNSQSVI